MWLHKLNVRTNMLNWTVEEILLLVNISRQIKVIHYLRALRELERMVSHIIIR